MADQGGTLVERTLALTEHITHIGSWEWQLSDNRVVWSDELYRIYGYEPQSRAITPDFFLSRVHPDDRDLVQNGVAQALERGGRFSWTERIVRPDGSVRLLETTGEVRGEERPSSLFGTCRDVTEQTRERRLQQAEHDVLEDVARGAPLEQSLEKLILAVEANAPPALGSVLLMHDDGLRVRHGAAPSLPESFQRAIDGAPIGPKAGSCGTAAFLKKPVLVDDIETDPLWEDYKELALAHGLRACWSTPILSTDERVLGTFAFYYTAPRTPKRSDLALVARVTRLAGIAIERHQMEDQLHNLSAHIQSVLEDERTAIAREIHDDLGQSLTVLKLDMAWITRRLQNGPPSQGAPSTEHKERTEQEVIIDKLRVMSEFTDGVIQRVRKISSELRPGVLDDLGLVAAIEWQAQAFQERTGTTCVVRSKGEQRPLTRDVSTAAFRIFQEALTNVARHARAQHVDVVVDAEDSELVLEVTDDGVGIQPDKANNPSSLGLLGVRERAQRLGGSVDVAPKEPHGTRLVLLLPLRTLSSIPPSKFGTTFVKTSQELPSDRRKVGGAS